MSMRGATIHTKVTVSLSLTADDWSLYNMPGRDEAAAAINRLVEDAINKHPRKEADAYGAAALEGYASYGAADSEGWAMLYRIFDKVLRAEGF